MSDIEGRDTVPLVPNIEVIQNFLTLSRKDISVEAKRRKTMEIVNSELNGEVTYLAQIKNGKAIIVDRKKRSPEIEFNIDNYSLKGTPCEIAASSKTCIFRDVTALDELKGEHRLLKKLGIKGYYASALGGDPPHILVTLSKENPDERRLSKYIQISGIATTIILSTIENKDISIISNQRKLLERLSFALAVRDIETFAHTKWVASMAVKLAKKIGINDVETLRRIYIAGVLHDIGKLLIPNNILKKPSRLSESESSIMKFHATFTKWILSLFPEFNQNIKKKQSISKIAAFHQEKWDGSGYPNHLKGEDIPIEARLLAIADVIVAMTEPRPYRKFSYVRDGIETYLRSESGKYFDPQLVEPAIELLQEQKSSGTVWRAMRHSLARDQSRESSLYII